MNFRTTIILAALALVVAGVIVLIDRSGGTEKPVADPSGLSRLYKDASPLDLTRIEIDRGQTLDSQDQPLGKVVLEKSGGKWQLTAPVTGPADEYQIGELARILAELSFGRTMSATPDNLKQFELEPPAALVKFTSGDGKSAAAPRVHELAVGGESGLGNDKHTYIRPAGVDSVYLAKGNLHQLVTDELSRFRDKNVVTVSPDEVARITVARGDDRVTAERTDRGWVITQPVQARGDSAELEGLVNNVAGLTVVEFVADQAGDAARYGLAKPRLVVTIEKKSKPAETKNGGEAAPVSTAAPSAAPDRTEAVTIAIGGYEDLQKTKLYAKISGVASVVTLPDATVRALDKDLFALRDKRGLPLDAEKIAALAIDLPGSKVSLSRQGTDWQITAPEKGPAESAEADGLVTRLASIRVKKFVDNATTEAAAYGLDQPLGKITFRDQGETRDTVVLVGKNRQSGELWLQESGAASAGRIDPADLDVARRTWLDLYRRQIWQVPEGHKISRVSWSREAEQGEAVEIVRQADTAEGKAQWAMAAPVKQELDTAKVLKLLEKVHKINAVRILGPADKAGDFGLDKPQIKLTVATEPAATSDGAAAARSLSSAVTLAITEKDKRLVAMELNRPAEAGGTRGNALVFEIDFGLAEQLEAPLATAGWGEFDKAMVTRVELAGPLKLRLNRAGEDWTAEKGDEELTINSMRVRWFIDELATTDATKVVRYSNANLADYGLDQPWWRIRVKGLSLDKVFLISEKSPPGGGHYATIEGSGQVVTLDASQSSHLIKDRNYFTGTSQ